MIEEWKPIKGYEGLYEVSNMGRIRNKKGKIRSLRKLENGYLTVGLSKDNKIKSYQVHRLVAIAFYENPLNKPFVNHENSDRADNRACNLKWVTQSENMQHSHNKKYKVRELPYIPKDTSITEEWKYLLGYEDLYMISNRGDIKNITTGKYRKPCIVNGYLRIRLGKKGNRKNYFIHCLVAQNFKEAIENKPLVNHKDGNKLNNNFNNLEWCTNKENVIHSLTIKKEPI